MGVNRIVLHTTPRVTGAILSTDAIARQEHVLRSNSPPSLREGSLPRPRYEGHSGRASVSGKGDGGLGRVGICATHHAPRQQMRFLAQQTRFTNAHFKSIESLKSIVLY